MCSGDDGVTYQQYVTELTYLLFLKMMKETGQEDKLPKAYRWDVLEGKTDTERFEHYRIMLVELGHKGKAPGAGDLCQRHEPYPQARHPHDPREGHR